MQKKFLQKVCMFFGIVGVLFWSVSPVFSVEQNLWEIRVEANGDVIRANEKISVISQMISSRFFNFPYKWLKIFVDINQKEPRGQIRGKEMKLSAILSSDAEFLKLFTHELGHFIDIYVLRRTTTQADPSLDFYKISWQSARVKHAESSLQDFVSGYAATNQYEDFSETFVWYIFHNDDFMDRAMKNEILRQKYLFFADNVFVHGEFQGTDFSIGTPPEYFWDTTKIPILLQKYLFFLVSSI